MIGYCKPDKEELRIKDYRRYSAYYCILCRTISRKYGFIYRFILSNDCTFLYICLDSLSNKKEMQKERCPFNPLKSVRLEANAEAAFYSAFINMYLMEQYLMDHIQDAGNVFSKTLYRLLYFILDHNKEYQNDRIIYNEITQRMDIIFEELDELEKNKSTFDQITNKFGELTKSFAVGFSDYMEGTDIRSFEVVLFNMGKWLYMADALDDYRKDQKSGSFNLLHTIQISESRLESEEEDIVNLYIQKCALIVLILEAKMEDAYHAVKWNESKEIILNFLSYGVQNTWRTIIKKRYIGKENPL